MFKLINYNSVPQPPKHQHYLKVYRDIFAKRTNPNVFELGVRRGASVRYWATLTNNDVVGLDNIKIKEILIGKSHQVLPTATELSPMPPNVTLYHGSQQDEKVLGEIAEKHGPFDIIIDDASHKPMETKASLVFLFDHLKTGGCYVIEDWACHNDLSSRLDRDWADQDNPTSNQFNLIGVVKDLIDELAIWQGSTHRRFGDSAFASIEIYENILVINKASTSDIHQTK